MTDLGRLRLRRAGFLGPDDGSSPGGGQAFVGKVTSPADKLGVGKFFLAQPAAILGPEAEGGVGSIADGTGSVAVYLLGPGVPGTGDYLICRRVDHRWVAERMTGGGGPPVRTVYLPSCSCPVPEALAMTSLDESCNYGMFRSSSLVYADPPDCFAALGITAKLFHSPGTFRDVITDSEFYYILTCQFNQFSLSRVYCDGSRITGSPGPFRDGNLYAWLTGGYGNSCDPFALHAGTPFPGSDATCKVWIDPG